MILWLESMFIFDVHFFALRSFLGKMYVAFEIMYSAYIVCSSCSCGIGGTAPIIVQICF